MLHACDCVHISTVRAVVCTVLMHHASHLIPRPRVSTALKLHSAWEDQAARWGTVLHSHLDHRHAGENEASGVPGVVVGFARCLGAMFEGAYQRTTAHLPPARAHAVMAAADLGHTTIVQALLDAKADASLQTKVGDTALMWAEQQKCTATAQLLRQHAEQQAPGRPYGSHRVSGTLSGRCVRISGLKGRSELNGRCGVAAYFDPAKGRYAVTVKREAEAVLLKPANLYANLWHPLDTRLPGLLLVITPPGLKAVAVLG